MRYLMQLAYQGRCYHGWQRQKNTPNTIQQIIEDTITKMLGKSIYIKGCGRTDAGVHASNYYAHIDLDRLPDYDFITRVNYMLPYDISIKKIKEVASDFDAQYDAISRSYEYYFHFEKTPRIHNTSAYYPIKNINMDRLRSTAKHLTEIKDYRSLCIQPDSYKHTLCNIQSVSVVNTTIESQYMLTITSNRFLRGMIRLLMARLIDIGTGKLTEKQFFETISTRESFTFPYHKQGHPQGLFLSNVIYPLNKERD